MTKVTGSIVSKAALATFAAFGAACHGGGAEVEVTAQPLTTVDIDRVLGFEATTVLDWSIIQSGPGTLSVSTTVSQGSRSLAVASHGYVPVQSVALTSLGSRVGSVIHYDIMLPTQLKQISPSYYGATQLYLNSTSLGLNNVYLGQVELTPLPLGQWNTVTFTPASSVLTKLRGTYTDLRVTIVVNAPYNATQPYLLDNLRFSDSTLALVTVVDGSGHAISGITVTGYNGSTPTSNTGVTDSTGVAKVWVPPGSYRFGVTEAGVTTYSSVTNQCQVPGICVAATILAKCHNVVCSATNACHNVGTCEPSTGVCSNPAKPAGTVCRAVAGPCDVAEVCDGTAAGCPADSFLQASFLCRPAAGPCDAVEVCSGTSAACPPDAFLPGSTVCRPSTSPCDPAENCTGGGPTCPVDITTGGLIPPTGVSAISGTAAATLAWTASPGATSYNVKRGTASGGPYTTVASVSSTSYVDTGLAVGPTYSYVVTSVAACGESAPSLEATATPVSGKIGNLPPGDGPPKLAPGSVVVPTPEDVIARYGDAAQGVPSQIPGTPSTAPKQAIEEDLPNWYARVRYEMKVENGQTVIAPEFAVQIPGPLTLPPTVEGQILVVGRSGSSANFLTTIADPRTRESLPNPAAPTGAKFFADEGGSLLLDLPEMFLDSEALLLSTVFEFYSIAYSVPVDTPVSVDTLPDLLNGSTLIATSSGTLLAPFLFPVIP